MASFFFLDDLDLDWGLTARAAKARAIADARFREAFDPTYGSWEEVHDALDDSDLENLEDSEFFNSSCGGSSWSTSGCCRSPATKVGESSTLGTQKEALESRMAGSLRDMPSDQSKTVSTSCTVMDLEGQRSDGVKQRKRKVIMGRDFLLVSRTCLPELDRQFQFFHMPSLSTVEVKVTGSTREVSSRAQPDVPPSLSKCVDAPS